MTSWPVHPVNPGLRLRTTGVMPSLAPALEAEVSRLWAAALERLPLFNGRVFTADGIGPDTVDGHWTEYRRVVAQMANPALRSVLGVRSLAVCGVLHGPDGVAVGRRDPASAYQAGLWQLPPAGSVDATATVPGGADWQAALLGELREELGIDPSEIYGLRPLCIVEHPSGVLDLGVGIGTSLDATAIRRRHQIAPHREEYDRLLVVPPEQVAERVAAAGGTLVPSADIFLRQAGLAA